MIGTKCTVICNLINTHTDTHKPTHEEDQGAEDAPILGYANASRLGGRYAGGIEPIPLRGNTRGTCGLRAGQLVGGPGSRDCR